MPPRTVVWLAGVMLLAGCVTVPEFRALEREVSALKGGGGGVAPNARLAELGSDVRELQAEVDRLRGELEETQHLAKRALDEAAAAREVGGEATRRAPPAGVSTGASHAQPGSLSDEVRAYEAAFRLYRKAEYAPAIDRFKGFLQTHPSSDYADNAQFWLGECYFKLDDYEQAVLAFDDVVKRYPEGNKVPDALYRQGIALMAIGKQTDQRDTYRGAASQIFEKLINEHPDSDRVPEARRQLEKLGT